MSPSLRQALRLPDAPAPGVPVFAVLFFVETLARASLATVVPLQAYDLLQGNKSLLSFLFSAVAVGALVFSLYIPAMIRHLGRSRVFSLGAVMLAVAAFLLGFLTLPTQIGGMLLRVFGAAAMNVAVQLYILDHIDRKDFARNDSVRLGFSTFGWSLAPFGGIWLYGHVGPWAVYGASMAASLVLLAIFHFVGMEVGRMPVAPLRSARPPLAAIRRFFAQPRLRLAWLIAFSRSAFWSAFFIYGPVLMVSTGKGHEAGGLLVSIGNAMLILVFVWKRVADRIGIRRVCGFAFLSGAGFVALAGLAGPLHPYIAGACLLAATVTIVSLDGVGGVPFYRAVRPLERAEMASVYRCYLDAAELVPPLVYGVLLAVFDLGSVFLALAALLAVAGVLSLRHIPQRL